MDAMKRILVGTSLILSQMDSPYSMGMDFDSEDVELGPAILINTHEDHEHYIGERVLIKEINHDGIFGQMCTCDYIGSEEHDGEYVRDTMFTDFHLENTECEKKYFPKLKTAKRYYQDNYNDEVYDYRVCKESRKKVFILIWKREFTVEDNL
jgi:hypothetical protein